MAEIASVSQRGKYEPFELQVARGQVAWHRAITVFGYNPDIDQTEETVWPGGGIYVHPATAVVMKVSSASTSDTAAGTGARTIVIDGLDADFNEISETVTLNGQTQVSTVKSYLRINYAYVASAGSGNGAAGNIYIGVGAATLGVPVTTYQIIKFDYNTSVTGHYTIPAGYTGYMDAGSINVGQAGGSNPVICRLVESGANNIRLSVAIVALNNGTASYDFKFPIVIPEKTDIEAAAVGEAANNFVTSYFNIVLIKNDGA